MRNSLYALCILLLLAAPARAAETLDEKVYDPGQRPPATTGPNGPDGRVTPGQTVPGMPGAPETPSDTIIIVPGTPSHTEPGQLVPGQLVPDQNGTIPVPPDTQKETPAIVVPAIPTMPTAPATPIPVPAVPKTPDAGKKDIIVTPVQPVQPVKPEEKTQPVPPKTEDKLLTPADFLPTTPQKKEPEKTEPKPKEERRADPKKDTPKKSKDSKEPKEPKPDPKKQAPKTEKKKGEALRIPPDAAQTGNMDFLEGCWQGRLSGRAGREVIDNMGSRFCFDANGKGKHFLYDPKRNETCVGSANGGVKPDGTLRVDFDNLYCPSGETWYPQGDKYMTCRDGGNGAECKWYHKGQPKTTGPFYRD